MAVRQAVGASPSGVDGSGAMAARRRLGRLLTELREARGITQEAAAEFIERVPSTLYKLESGRPGVRIRIKHDIHSLCDLYEVDDTVREGLVQLAEATRVRGWFQPYQNLLPPNFDAYLGLEQDATELETYETELVPGLLQTEQYARALIGIPQDPPRSDEEIERRVSLRLRRQEVLTRHDPVRLNAVLNEAVLRRVVGGPGVMAGQLLHLDEIGKLPNVAVRVLPFRAGEHWGLDSGKFMILRFLDDNEPPMVYSDSLLGGLWFKESKEISRFRRVFANVAEKALDEERSRALISQAAKELQRHAIQEAPDVAQGNPQRQ